MQNLNNLNNLNALGIKGGTLFDPSSISVGGVKLLKQQLLTKRTPTLGGILYDERKNKGTARPVQVGRCYLMDGTNDQIQFPSTGFEFLDDPTKAWSAEFYINPDNLVGVRRFFAKQLNGGTYRGVSVYTNGPSLRFDILDELNTKQLTVSVTSFTPVVGTVYKVKMMYNGNRLATGVTWEINEVAYTSTAITQTLVSGGGTTSNSGSPFKISGDGPINVVSNPYAGRIWGVKLWDDTNTLRFFAKCDEQGGLSSLDSSGYTHNGLNGVIANATLSTFHNTQDVISYQNDVGYSDMKNYWKYSQEFDQTNWSKNGGSITSIVQPDPLGTSLADTFTEDGTTGNHRLFQASAYITGVTYTVSVYLKYRNRRYVSISHGGNSSNIICDLQTGVISGSNGTIVSSSMTNVGGGWYRCAITAVSTTTGNSSSVIAGSTTGTGTGTTSYTGSATDAFEIFGSQIEVGTLTQYQRNLLLEPGNKVPRNESIPTQCVLGCPLQYTGEVPYDGDLEASSCTVVNGTNQYWNIADNAIFDITNNLSVIIRAKNSSTIGAYSEHLITKWTETGNFREWVIGVNLTQKPYVALSSNGSAVAVYTATDAITVSNETTYGFTFSSGTVKLYVNGVLVAGSVTTGSIPASLNNGTSPIAIGSVFASGSVNWKGSLWDARIYKDAVLTDAEMLAIHNGTETTVGATPVAHYPMAEVAGNIIYDVISTNHGTGVNAPTRGTQNSYHYNIVEGCSKYMYFDGVNDSVTASAPNEVVNRFDITIVTDSDINNATSGKTLLNYDTTADYNWVMTLGSCTTAFAGEVITIGGASGVRTGVLNITIPRGKNILSARWNGTNYDIYLNNVLQTMSQSGGGVGQITLKNFILGTNSNGTASFDGVIKEVSIYNTSDVVIHRYINTGNANADWQDLVGTVDGNVSGSPVNIYIPAKSSTLDVFGDTLQNPAGPYHNGCESLIDFTGNVLSPQAVINSWETAWAFNSARTNPEFKRTLTSGGIDFRADRFLAYSQALSGGNLTKVNKYVTTKAI